MIQRDVSNLKRAAEKYHQNHFVCSGSEMAETRGVIG